MIRKSSRLALLIIRAFVAVRLASAVFGAGVQTSVRHVGTLGTAEAPAAQKALYQPQLAETVRVINTWWHEHGPGFRSFAMRVPRASWIALEPSLSKDREVIGFAEERVGDGEPIWYASTSIDHPGSWTLSFAPGGEYAFEWKIDLVSAEPKLVEVRMIYPAIDWRKAK